MLTYYGTALCPDCVAATALLAEKGVEAEYIDITASTANLKAFLALRDADPAFAPAKTAGNIGIPAFVLPGGTVVLGTDWLTAQPD